MTTYRVEKDGITFYVQPEQIEYYAANGWAVYKTVEEQVTDAAAEATEAIAASVAGASA